jgi:hypothetical protein
VGVRCRRPRVGLECARDKAKRVRMVAALMLENAVEVECVEIIRIGVEGVPIERFSFAQLTTLVTQNRLSQRFGGGSRGNWFGLWFRHASMRLHPLRTQHHRAGTAASESVLKSIRLKCFVQADSRVPHVGIGTGPISFGTR